MNCKAFSGELPIVDAAIDLWTETGDGTTLVQYWQGDDTDVNCIVGLTEAEVASFMAQVKSRGDQITERFRHQTEFDCWDVMVKPIFLMENPETLDLFTRYLQELDEGDQADFVLHLQLTFNEPWGPVTTITYAYMAELIETEAW